MNCGKFLKWLEYQTNIYIKKQQIELDMEKQAASKSGKDYAKAAYCHSAYLSFWRYTTCEMPGWMKKSLNQDCWE